MKKSTRNWLIIIASIIVLLAIATAMGWLGKKSVTEVDTALAETKDIVEMVSANGKIEPVTEVKISAEVSGEIVELPIIEGQLVEKGQLLAVINPELIKAASDQANATLNQSKANLANAKARLAQSQANFNNAEANFKRNKQLYEKKAISALEYDNLNNQFQTAKADLDAAKESVNGAEFNVQSLDASLKQARESLLRTRIYAPNRGTISKLNVKLGERVVGTAQMSGTELMRVADLKEMMVNVSVNENDIVRVHQNDTALIEVDAYPKRKFKGVVFQLANSAKESAVGSNSADQVTNFEVKVKILASSYQDLMTDDTTKSPFRPGMSSAVDIQTRKEKGALAIPIQSVTPRKAVEFGKSPAEIENETKSNEASKEYVFVLKAGKVEQVEVETGIQDNDVIQIVKGLKKGEEVVSGPYSAISKTLRNQEPVVKKSEKK